MMEKFSVESPNNNKNEQWQSFGLEKGKEVKFVKFKKITESDVAEGTEISGVLDNDITIGEPIRFANNTSVISNIEDFIIKKGRIFLKTHTSIYEYIPEYKPEGQTSEIMKYKSFTTEKGSTYTVLPNGQVQRYKKALLDDSYSQDDKGESPDREPSDILFFIRDYGWFDDIGAEIGDTKISKTIDIGVYCKDESGVLNLIKRNKDISEPFIFVRVNKRDNFTLKPKLTIDELVEFYKRTYLPENKGLGVILSSENESITQVPSVGHGVFDYRFGEDGEVESMHCGNKIVSFEKRE